MSIQFDGYDGASGKFVCTRMAAWAGRSSGTNRLPTFSVAIIVSVQTSQIVSAFRETLRHAADAFKPDLVLLSAGFDSRAGDPLGRFTLSDADFTDLTRIMLEIAGTHASGRLVSVLEGGYNLTGLEAAVSAHLKALAAA